MVSPTLPKVLCRGARWRASRSDGEGVARLARRRVSRRCGNPCRFHWVVVLALMLLSLGGTATAAPIPGRQSSVDAASGSSEPLPAEQAFQLTASVDSAVQVSLHWRMPKGYYLYRDRTKLSVLDDRGVVLGSPQWPRGATHQDPQLGEVVVYFGQVDVPIAVRAPGREARNFVLRARFQGCLEGSVCYAPLTREISIALPYGGGHAPSAEASATTRMVVLAGAIAAALLGGLLLNLMPCVLPILSLKVLTLLKSGEDVTAARRHARYYTAGVMVSFAGLGLTLIVLRATGRALGWGFQLQQPLVLGGLAFILLAVGLSMSGVVHFGVGMTSLGGRWAAKGGRAGDFFTGALACVVAAPCTVPFMGSALAFALAVPAALALAIFVALGLGLALPFLLIGYFPAARRWLPRPGAWMGTLKQVLAYPMYLTAVWLIWVFGKQRGIDAMGLALAGAVLLSLGLWWSERSRCGRVGHRVLAGLIVAVAVLPLYAGSTLAASPETGTSSDRAGTVRYSPERLAELRRQHDPVFLEVSADWCITCKVNERTILAGAEFRALLDRTGTIYMNASYTDVSPMVTALLDRYHAVGVPLYLVFPKDGGEGRALPRILTSATVHSAIEWAAR